MKEKLYFAPLEGITGYVYRNAHKKYFGGVDKYFLPFLVTNQNGKLKSKERNDVLPENNQGMTAVPQILTNHAKQFILMADFLGNMGYEEINLNLGCPARTVVSKKKGSGFLAYPDELDRFLEEVYDGISIKLSIKTRLGIYDAEEFHEILKVYNRYPVEELIIHPRVQKDFYNNTPNWETFLWAANESVNPVCYNGDIFSKEDYEKWRQQFPDINLVMLGRGLLKNPGLADEIHGKPAVEKERLKAFHDELLVCYEEVMSGERNVLFKMKEVWCYMGSMFGDADKYLKEMRKANRLSEYLQWEERLFEEKEITR